VGFEPTISAGKRPKTYTLDLAATTTGVITVTGINKDKIDEFAKILEMTTEANIHSYEDLKNLPLNKFWNWGL
jgi:hypothetical protein